MNKHIFRTILYLFLPLVFFSGITGPLRTAGAVEIKKIKMVASFYPVYITAKNVTRGVPGVSVENLTPPMTGCLHDYTLSTGDMRKLADAQIFVANGAGMESFLTQIISAHPHLKTIELSEGIPLIRDPGTGDANPHVWVSISNDIVQVENLGKAMENFDPVHKELYRKNVSMYVAKLEKLRQKMHTGLAPYKGRSIITFHEAFPYFAGEFGFKIAAVIEREPGSEPSAKELADTVNKIRKAGIAALFSEPQYPASAAYTIAKETGSHVYMLDPGVTGPDDYDAYIKTMENNLKVLKEAFRQYR